MKCNSTYSLHTLQSVHTVSVYLSLSDFPRAGYPCMIGNNVLYFPSVLSRRANSFVSSNGLAADRQRSTPLSCDLANGLPPFSHSFSQSPANHRPPDY